MLLKCVRPHYCCLLQYFSTDLSAIEGFYIYYKEDGSSQEYSSLRVNGAHTRSITLSRLRPNTYYRLMMTSYNSAGHGPQSLDVVDHTADRTRVLPTEFPYSTRPEVSFYPPLTATRRPPPVLPPRERATSGDSVLLYAVLAAVIGILLFLLFLFLFLCWLKQKKRQQSRE